MEQAAMNRMNSRKIALLAIAGKVQKLIRAQK